MRSRTPFLLPGALLSAGCLTSELSESWVVDRLRVLAVRPEPAEPAPGDTVTFEALVVSPDAPVELLLWLGCLADEAGVLGCELDPAVLEQIAELDPEDMSPEELAALYEKLSAAGLIGAEPWLPPSYTVPEDLLDGLDEAARNEGLSLFVQVTAIPEGAQDESDAELAYKRVPISGAVTPNHNPEIASLTWDGVEILPGVVVEVDAGQRYTVEPILAEGAVEDYRYLDSEGRWEDRTEEPYFSIFVQEGSLDASNTLYPWSDFTWTAPRRPEATEQTIWILVQDRRGGMAWWTQPIYVRE